MTCPILHVYLRWFTVTLVAISYFMAFPAFSMGFQTPIQKNFEAHERGVRIIQSSPAPDGDNPTGANPARTGGSVAGPIGHSILPVCARPNPNPDLTYRSQPEFDRALSAALSANKPVTVDLAEPYDERNPPPGDLQSWLAEVKSAGGAVVISPYCAGGRGLGQNWFSDFVQHLTRSIYRPAKHYDVTLYADASRRKITQIAFRPKPVLAADRK